MQIEGGTALTAPYKVAHSILARRATLGAIGDGGLLKLLERSGSLAKGLLLLLDLTRLCEVF